MLSALDAGKGDIGRIIVRGRWVYDSGWRILAWKMGLESLRIYVVWLWNGIVRPS
jgi:hypothetical protein